MLDDATPAASMPGTTAAHCSLNIARTSVGARVSLKVVKARQVREQDADHPFLAAQLIDGRRALLPDPLGDHRRQVRPEGRVEAAQLASGLVEQPMSVSVAPLAAQARPSTCPVEPPSSSAAATAAMAPACQRSSRARVRLEVQAAEGPRERAAAPVLAARAEGDRHERGEHEHVPLPPAQPPVATEDDGDHGLGQQEH